MSTLIMSVLAGFIFSMPSDASTVKDTPVRKPVRKRKDHCCPNAGKGACKCASRPACNGKLYYSDYTPYVKETQ